MAFATIDKGSKYFNTVTYTGTGATNTLTGVGFQPDLVWIKQRGSTTWHNLYDVLRGTTKALASNDTGADDTRATGLTAFTSDGFTVGTDNNANGSSNTYVAWNWKANGTGVSNTAGTISSTVSANTTSGFSIVSYTGNATSGATVGHGLGVTPKMIIVKRRDGAVNWIVYHSGIGATKYIQLNTSGAEELQSSYNMFNSTAPTSSLFTLGNLSNTNGNTNTYIAYCFAEVKGFSKFGSYTGNGSTDGTFVYTGFSPAFVMVKSTSAAGTWCMLDNKRSSFNEANKIINAEDSVAEFTATGIDFTSNGFKHRNSNTNRNASGVDFIYMAFAQNPFVSSKGLPTTAR